MSAPSERLTGVVYGCRLSCRRIVELDVPRTVVLQSEVIGRIVSDHRKVGCMHPIADRQDAARCGALIGLSCAGIVDVLEIDHVARCRRCQAGNRALSRPPARDARRLAFKRIAASASADEKTGRRRSSSSPSWGISFQSSCARATACARFISRARTSRGERSPFAKKSSVISPAEGTREAEPDCWA